MDKNMGNSLSYHLERNYWATRLSFKNHYGILFLFLHVVMEAVKQSQRKLVCCKQIIFLLSCVIHLFKALHGSKYSSCIVLLSFYFKYIITRHNTRSSIVLNFSVSTKSFLIFHLSFQFVCLVGILHIYFLSICYWSYWRID